VPDTLPLLFSNISLSLSLSLLLFSKTRKFAKQELKVILDEFETKVTCCFNVHKENNNVIAKAKQSETKACQKTRTKKRPSKVRPIMKINSFFVLY
jgi:hypothetical protein